MLVRMARRTCAGSVKSTFGGVLLGGRFTSRFLIVQSSVDLGRFAQPRKSAFEIVNQIIDVLESNMDANRWTGRVPPCAGPQRGRISGDHQAFVSAPAVPELEKIHVIEERGECT